VAIIPRPDVEKVVSAAQSQIDRNRKRIERGLDILLAREEPPVGVTPKDVIYSRGTLRLYHYRPMTDEVYRVPVVFVMSLVSKPWILDLTLGQSFVQYLLAQGFDVFMIDWGVPRPEDKKLKFEDYVQDFMPACFEQVQKATGEEEFTILGYCMGGMFALMYAGLHPEAPIKNIVCAATPVDMEGMGLFRSWAHPSYFDVDRVVDSMGNIPPELMLRSFEFLRPLDRWMSYIRLVDNLWDPTFVYGYRIMYKWTNEQIPFPGETYRQFIRDLMWENKLLKGTMTIGGKKVDTEAIKCPVFHALAEHDHIAPFAATRPLLDIVASDDKEEVILKGGHVSLIAGKNAVGRLWPRVAEWLGERSV
jgi:polyhydroxyalkanoate synthase